MNCPECHGTMKHKWTQNPEGKDMSVWTCVDCFHRISRIRKKNSTKKPVRLRIEKNGFEKVSCRICGMKHRVESAVKLDESGNEIPGSGISVYKCGGRIFLVD